MKNNFRFLIKILLFLIFIFFQTKSQNPLNKEQWGNYVENEYKKFVLTEDVDIHKESMLKLLEKFRGNDSVNSKALLLLAAEFLIKESDSYKALMNLNKSINLLEDIKWYSMEHIDLLINLFLHIYKTENNFIKQRDILIKGINLIESNFGKYYTEVGYYWGNLYDVYLKIGDTLNSNTSFLNCIEIFEKTNGVGSKIVSSITESYIKNLEESKHYDEILSFFNHKISEFEKNNYDDNEYLISMLKKIEETNNKKDIETNIHGKYSNNLETYKRIIGTYEKFFNLHHLEIPKYIEKFIEESEINLQYKIIDSFLYEKNILYSNYPERNLEFMNEFLSKLNEFYDLNNNLEKEENTLLRIIGNCNEIFGEISDISFSTYQKLSKFYYKNSDSTRSSDANKKAEKIKIKFENLFVVTDSLNKKCKSYSNDYKYNESIEILKKLIIVYETLIGKENAYIYLQLSGIASCYSGLGNYFEAEKYYKEAYRIIKKFSGDFHPITANCLNNLAIMCYNCGNYPEAEFYFKKAIESYSRIEGNYSLKLYELNKNLAIIYINNGRFKEAEGIYQKLFKILYKENIDENYSFSEIYLGLSLLFSAKEENQKAEHYCRKALKLIIEGYGKESKFTAMVESNLATYLIQQAKYSESEDFLNHSITILENEMNFSNEKDKSFVITSLQGAYSAKALIHYTKSEFDSVLVFYNKTLELNIKLHGQNHPSNLLFMSNLALCFMEMNRLEESEKYFEKALDFFSMNFKNFFSYSNENDRLAYLSRNSLFFTYFYNFLNKFYLTNPNIAGKAYNLALWQKGVVLSSVREMKEAVENSSDTIAMQLFGKLVSNRRIYSNFLSMPNGDLSKSIEEIKKINMQSDSIERDLSKLVYNWTKYKALNDFKWQDIYNKLNDDEAAIEFISFRYSNIKWTDTIFYGALIITKETKTNPAFILLSDETSIANSILNFKSNLRNRSDLASFFAKELFASIWKPLEQYIINKKRIFIATDGFLNIIPFEVLLDQENKFVIEKYNICYLLSTKDILKDIENKNIGKKAILIGNPNFSYDCSDTLHENIIDNDNSIILNRSIERFIKLNRISPLPGTQIEIDEINNLLTDNNWQIRHYTQNEANKNALISINKPTVLHIATHGFFLGKRTKSLLRSTLIDGEDNIYETNPMLNSGILLTGAGKYCHDSIFGDGIFTAFDFSNLNLTGTDLVVISACETGLGDIQTGEGVFGLKRSVFSAGSKSIILSLWSVSDEVTQELMTNFYKIWLSGKTKREAFREAQLEIKAKYPQPYFWGAFVMVGE